MTKSKIEKMIAKADKVYQLLQGGLGSEHADVMYIKGHRDAYLKIYKLINN